MTSISYLDEHLPLVTGCSECGPVCFNCWAARNAATRLKHHPFYEGLASQVAGYLQGESLVTYEWTGEVRCHTEVLDKAYHWRRPRAIGVAFTGDLCHEAVPNSVIEELLLTCEACPQHQFIFTTKRPENLAHKLFGIEAYRLAGDPPELPPNLWVGVSCWDQSSLDRAMRYLLEIPAKQWVSLEPLLGEVTLWPKDKPCVLSAAGIAGIGGIVLGCESGPNARPMELDWARRVRDDCADAGVPFYFKQAISIGGDLVHEPALDGTYHVELPWKGGKLK